MKKNPVPPADAARLRRLAEERLKKNQRLGAGKYATPLSADKTQRLFQELQIHQIELEMQNEELRLAQRDLEASRARYFDLYDLAPVGYFTISEAGLTLEANLTAATMLSLARGAMLNQPLTRLILPEDRDICSQCLKLLFKTGAPQMCELRMVKKDSAPFWAQMETRLGQNAEDAPICRVAVSDITVRKRVEAELQQLNDELEHRVRERTEELMRANEELRMDIINRKRMEKILYRTEENFRSSQENSPLGIRIMTEEGETIYANRAILDIHGYDSIDELKATPVIKRYTPESFAEVQIRRGKRKRGENGPGEYEIRIVRKDGAIRHLQVFRKEVLWDGERQFQVTCQDITERKRAEKEVAKTLHQLQETRDMLIQSEKHAAVGRLAAGVAHEILNPVSIISSRLQFLEEQNLSDQALENVRVSREQLQRIVKISHDLFQSSAKKTRALVGGDLRRVIEVGLQMTERRRKEDNVQTEYNPLPETIPVKMETDSMVKVVVHLILNACDAMTGNNSKRLIVATHHPEVVSTKPSVRLIFADNGHGIPAGDFNKIFDPFFTTKAPGKGTGLGLSVCNGIIQEHGGTIRAESNDVGGASFVVELPLFYP